MTIEYLLLAAIVGVSLALIVFIPRDKRRIALTAFLIKQVMTYIIGLYVVELGLLSYPVRFLADINRTSLTYEFLAYPMICALSISYFPFGRRQWIQVSYLAAWTTLLTVVEVVFEKFTELITYVHWYWYWSWGMIFLTFVLSTAFCAWFFNGLKLQKRNSPLS